MSSDSAEVAVADGGGPLAALVPYVRDTAVVRGEDPAAWNATATAAFGVLPEDLLLAARQTLPWPRPGDRYHARGMTGLWLALQLKRSTHTADSYGRSLRLWLDYCWKQQIDPLTAITPDVDDWTTRMRAAGASTSTITVRLAAIGSWYLYLRKGVAITDPVSDAERPAADPDDDESEAPHLSLQEAGDLFRTVVENVEDADTIEQQEIALRTAALLWTLLVPAIRSGAVLDATVGSLSRQGSTRRLSYHLKGRSTKKTHSALPPAVSAVLDDYLAVRAERLGVEALDPDAPLFATLPDRGHPGNRPVTRGNATKTLRALARQAGIAHWADLVLHSLRHTAASVLLNDLGESIDGVRRLLRHKRITTTQLYLHPGEQSDAPAFTLAAALSAEIVLRGSGTLARNRRTDLAAAPDVHTQAAIQARERVRAVAARLADSDAVPQDVAVALVETLAAAVERCDTADPAFGALAEAVRATIAGGLAVITSG